MNIYKVIVANNDGEVLVDLRVGAYHISEAAALFQGDNPALDAIDDYLEIRGGAGPVQGNLTRLVVMIRGAIHAQEVKV